MPDSAELDAVVVGAGPNGLAAAITLARAGLRVRVYEAAATVGGGTRSAELTLPGFLHDVCSAVHPLGLASPFFRSLPLAELGLEFIQPPLPLAHPLDDGSAVALARSVDETAAGLGGDAAAYRRVAGFLKDEWQKIIAEFLGPLRAPRHPLAMTGFGLLALQSARGLAERAFRGPRARALFAGLAAHSIQPLEASPTAAFGLMLGMLAHGVGWPVVRGGSQQIAEALARQLRCLGGEIVTGWRVEGLEALPSARLALLDVTPRQFLALAGPRLPGSYREALTRYRYGPGVFKLDFALDGPVPWRAPECHQAGTVHLGGTLPEIAASESAIWRGQVVERPYVLVAQQSLFDPGRAPAGRHTLWAYCHVPHGSTQDMRGAIEAQIERFAPGFRERILARHTYTATELERYNPNYVGGDINGGVQDFRQLFTRPAVRFPPYSTPLPGVFLCSSSTPPGGGVHGMCGYYAAQAALAALQRGSPRALP